MIQTQSLLILAVVAAATAAETKGPGLAASILAAQHAESQADSSKASTYVDRALALDGDNTSLLRMSYMLHAAEGDIPAAATAAKQFLAGSVDGPRTTAQLVVAVDQHKKKEHEQAWTTISELSGQGFIAATLPAIRAWIRAPKATVDEALAELAPLRANDKARDTHDLMAAMINEFYSRPDQAKALYDDVAGRVDKLPLTAVALLAGGYHRQGRAAELKAVLETYRAARVRSRDTGVFVDSFNDPKMFAKVMSADVGLSEAMFLTAQQMIAATQSALFTQLAVIYGRAALHLNPANAMARWIIGNAASQAGAVDAANAMLQTIKASDPMFVSAQLQLAENLEKQGRKADAMAQLQSLARLRPNDAEPHLALADLLRGDQKFAAAVDSYDKAFALMPDEQKDNWVLLYMRGIALERSKNWSRAEADFKRALEISPEEPWVLNYLGYSWLDRGENVAEARKLIERAYKKRPDDGAIVDSLGWAMYLAGEYEQSVTLLEKAAELNAADSTINSHLGDAYWKVGRRNEARFQWRRALSLSTDEAEKTALRGKLDQGLALN